MSANVFSAQYDANKVGLLYQRVLSASNNNQKQDYEIHVDKFKVVPRTSDPMLFNSYGDFITPDTKCVMIIMYRGGSNHSDRYFFYMDTNPQQVQALAGFGELQNPQEWKKEQLERMHLENDLTRLKKENDELIQKLEEKTLLVTQLERDVEAAKEGKLTTTREITAAVGSGLMQIPVVKDLFGKIPGLAGVPENNKQSQQQPTFEREEDDEADEEDAEEIENGKVKVMLDEDEQGYLQLLRDMEAKFERQELASSMHVLDLLTKHKDGIGPVIRFLNKYIKEKEKQKDNEKI